jgi:putative redox protein
MTIHVQPRATGGFHYTATMEGHDLPLDMPAPQGEGPDPHDYFDAALGGCKALTLMVYAKGHGIPLEGVDVQVARDQTDERRGEYRLAVRLKLQGQLSDEQVATLLAVADRCPVHKLMTTTNIAITTEGGRA